MYALCGAIRRMGESDDCIVRLAKKDGILAKYVYNLLVINVETDDLIFTLICG